MCYNGNNKKLEKYKSFLSSDGVLQLGSLKLESLVIADHLSRGEHVLEFCTNRPSRAGRVFALSGFNFTISFMG